MTLLAGIDHVAITVADLEASCAFYTRLFGAEVLRNHVFDGRPAVRALAIGGGAQVSIHQAGNGVDLVARKPTPGSVDICFRWRGSIKDAVTHLTAHGVAIVDGPSPRQTNDRLPAHSVYFRDLDGNLMELMAAD